MENLNQYTAEELQKCPYHNHQAAAGHDDPSKNTGDWGDLDDDDEAGTDPARQEDAGNDNSGDTGRSGSATRSS